MPLDRLRDAANFVMQWIYQKCPKNGLPNELTDAEVLDRVRQLFDAAMAYSSINDAMNLIHNDWRDVLREGDKYILSYTSDRQKQLAFPNADCARGW